MIAPDSRWNGNSGFEPSPGEIIGFDPNASKERYFPKLFETRGLSSSGLLTIVYCKACGLDLESRVKCDSIPVPLGNKVLPGWVWGFL